MQISSPSTLPPCPQLLKFVRFLQPYYLADQVGISSKAEFLSNALFVDLNELNEKCKALTAAQIDAFYTWAKENKNKTE